MADELSLRYLGRHTTGRATGPAGLREMLRRPAGSVRVSHAPTTFSVMAHNMALLPIPGFYRGTDRSGAIGEIVGRIAALRPTVRLSWTTRSSATVRSPSMVTPPG